MFLVLLFYVFRCFNSYFTFKTKNPIKEHLAYCDLCYNSKILLVTSIDLDVGAKTVDDGIHNTIVTNQFNFPAGSVVHAKSGVDVFVHIKSERSRNDTLVENLWTLIYTVNTMATYRLILVREPNNIMRLALSSTQMLPYIVSGFRSAMM